MVSRIHGSRLIWRLKILSYKKGCRWMLVLPKLTPDCHHLCRHIDDCIFYLTSYYQSSYAWRINVGSFLRLWLLPLFHSVLLSNRTKWRVEESVKKACSCVLVMKDHLRCVGSTPSIIQKEKKLFSPLSMVYNTALTTNTIQRTQSFFCHRII